MRPSSLGGGRILRRTLSVRLSVCLSVCLSVRPVIITERHVAPPSELKWHTRWGPHIVRLSRPHKFLFLLNILDHVTQIYSKIIKGALHEINQMVNLVANHLVKRGRVAGDANPRLKLT